LKKDEKTVFRSQNSGFRRKEIAFSVQRIGDRGGNLKFRILNLERRIGLWRESGFGWGVFERLF
jgi:hypothetical protein